MTTFSFNVHYFTITLKIHLLQRTELQKYYTDSNNNCPSEIKNVNLRESQKRGRVKKSSKSGLVELVNDLQKIEVGKQDI